MEWRNAIVFWVNIGGVDYNNLFLKGGAEMTWFGGSKQTSETPIIKRMIASQQAKHADSNDELESVVDAPSDDAQQKHADNTTKTPTQQTACDLLLMCRQPGDPYVFCGRLAAVSMNVESSPITVRWQLLDHSVLKEAPLFKAMLAASLPSDTDERTSTVV